MSYSAGEGPKSFPPACCCPPSCMVRIPKVRPERDRAFEPSEGNAYRLDEMFDLKEAYVSSPMQSAVVKGIGGAHCTNSFVFAEWNRSNKWIQVRNAKTWSRTANLGIDGASQMSWTFH